MPSSMACWIPNTSPAASRIVVTPRIRSRFDSIQATAATYATLLLFMIVGILGSESMVCQWMSMRPGVRKPPFPSITASYPNSGLPEGIRQRILCPPITTSYPVISSSLSPLKMETFVISFINIPEVWTFSEGCSRTGTKVLQEPFIKHYQKFNSNTGWADNDTPWPRVMQALSHFSYHVSGRQFVLCDLQGGLYTNGVCLTDPVILSRNKQYGVTDLGPKGISSFFSNHTCNEYCKSNWSKPKDQGRYFAPSEGTSMMMTKGAAGTGAQQRVPTQRNRNQMSAVYEY
jgi:hypothetical protein